MWFKRKVPLFWLVLAIVALQGNFVALADWQSE
jgi:hypothetical protein